MTRLRLERISRAEWESIFEKAVVKNISQDWLFGEIKSSLNAVEVTRFKIVDNSNVLGIVQAYIKKIPFLPLRVVYINRGPIFLSTTEDLFIQSSFNLICSTFSVFNGCLMLINPFLVSCNENYALLKKSGLIGIRKRDYITSYVNLRSELEVLRKNLNSKWRNQLVVAEKKNIRIKIDLSGEYLDFVIEKHSQMMIENKFKGLSSDEIRLLFKKYSEVNQLLNFIGIDENSNLIAYTIVLGYGKHAVYLMGWVDMEARKLNPSNLLLWNAIVFLKTKGYISFDLGGIDPVNLPGVSKFKRGISGKEYVYTENWINARLI